MSFTSLTFAAFCIAVLVLYWLVQRKGWQNIILLVASYVFYGWIHPWYLILLGLSTLADYFLASGISRFRERARTYLTLSLILNLGVLAFFKYYNFFNDALAARLGLFGLNTDVLLVSLALPAGLSFYTLKKLSYILDVSRGTLKPSENLVDFALYVSFFPQIISGPIDRPQKLFPQIEAARRWQADFFTSAWPLIVMGIFKKVVVADTIKSIVDRVFSLQAPSKLLVLAAALGFTLQILADFSAYTDISRGIARLFGFETSENFRTPYLSLTPSEFWNRWHITLSNFLRDYIFFPLRRCPAPQTDSALLAGQRHPAAGDDVRQRPLARRRLDLPGLGPLLRLPDCRLPVCRDTGRVETIQQAQNLWGLAADVQPDRVRLAVIPRAIAHLGRESAFPVSPGLHNRRISSSSWSCFPC